MIVDQIIKSSWKTYVLKIRSDKRYINKLISNCLPKDDLGARIYYTWIAAVHETYREMLSTYNGRKCPQ